MALDYTIECSCPIQDDIGAAKVGDVSKLRDMVTYFESNKDAVLANNPGKTLDQVEIHMAHPFRPEKTVTFGSIRGDWAKYQAIGQTCCSDCPVNFRRRELGCYGAVNYPLTTHFERWLIENFNPPAGVPERVMELIDEYGVTGEDSDAHRGLNEQGRGIYESRVPLRKTLPDREEPVSTTQILNLLMGIKTIEPALSWSLLLDFNAVAANAGVIDEINKLILFGIDPSEKSEGDPNLFLQTNPYHRIQIGSEGGMVFETAFGLPHSLMSDENKERFTGLVGQTKFTLQGEKSDDRPLGGFKQFLYANYFAVKRLSSILADG